MELKNHKGQSVSGYIFILFGIALVFNLGFSGGGYQALMWNALAGEVGTDRGIGEAFINSLGDIFSNPTLLAILGVSAVASFLLGGASFSAVYIIPLFILGVLANVFVIPSAFFFDNSLGFIGTVLGLIMNLWLMLAIVNFMKGGGG